MSNAGELRQIAKGGAVGGVKYHYTPFGVFVSDAGLYKEFDEDTFFEDILTETEKQAYAKAKGSEGLIKNSDAAPADAVHEIASGLVFLPFPKPFIGSSGRLDLAKKRILSGTWALDKSAIPDFISLIEKLEKNYWNVLGDDTLMDGLASAKRRAQELANEPVEASSSAKIGGAMKPVFSNAELEQARTVYVQQLTSTGIPAERANALADEFIAGLQQSNEELASAVAGSEEGGSMFSAASLFLQGSPILSAPEEDLGLGGIGSDPAGEPSMFDPPEGEQEGGLAPLPEDPNLEEDFMAEVNDLDAFGGASPEVSPAEVSAGLSAVGKIVDALRQAEGGEGQMTSDEISFVLDQVDDLANSFMDEGGSDLPADDFAPLEPVMDFGSDLSLDGGEPAGEDAEPVTGEGLEGILAASYVRVINAGSPLVSGFKGVRISYEDFGGAKTPIVSGLQPVIKFEENVPDDLAHSAVILSSVPKLGKDTPLQMGCIRGTAFGSFVRQSPEHRAAWRIASSAVGKLLGHRPKGLAGMAAVLACATAVHSRLFAGDRAIKLADIRPLLSGRSGQVTRKVLAVSSARHANGKTLRVIKSDYNGYKNYQTWNAQLYLRVPESSVAGKVREWVKSSPGGSYDQMIRELGLHGSVTPDGVAWADPRIDRGEVNKVLGLLGSSANMHGGNMKPINSNATQVDGGGELDTQQPDTLTGVTLDNRTLNSDAIDDPNGPIPVQNVFGGDTSEITPVTNAGDMGSLEADLDPGTPGNETGWDFETSKISAIEVPLEEEVQTHVLELKEIGSGVHILKNAYSSGREGHCRFVRGEDARKLVASCARDRGGPASYSLPASLDGRVVSLKNKDTALFIQSSPLLGVVVFEAPLQKAPSNVKYSVFSRAGLNMVNADGCFMRMEHGPQMLIASAAGNKAVRTGTERVSALAKVERAYVSCLRSSVVRTMQENAELKSRLARSIQSARQRDLAHKNALHAAQQSHRQALASSVADLSSLQKAAADREAAAVFSNGQAAMEAQHRDGRSQTQRNIDYLAKMYP